MRGCGRLLGCRGWRRGNGGCWAVAGWLGQDRPLCVGIECGGDLLEVPGAGDAVADDLVEGRGQRLVPREGVRCRVSARSRTTARSWTSWVLESRAFRVSLRGFADAVAAELDDLVCGEDVGGFDVLVDEAGGVQGLDGGDEAGGDLAGLFNGEGAVAEHVGEVGVGGLQDGVDERGAVEDGLAEFLQGDEVGLLNSATVFQRSRISASSWMGFDEAEDGGSAGTVVGGEEGAAAFGRRAFSVGKMSAIVSSLVVVPKLHSRVPFLGGIWLQGDRPGKRRVGK